MDFFDLAMDTKIANSGGNHLEARRANGLPGWKRALDLGLILLLSPAVLLVGVVVALLIKLGSSGPVFFRQKRVGF